MRRNNLIIAIAFTTIATTAFSANRNYIIARRSRVVQKIERVPEILSRYDGLYALWDFNSPDDSFAVGGVIHDRVGTNNLTVIDYAFSSITYNNQRVAGAYRVSSSGTGATKSIQNFNSSSTNGTILVFAKANALSTVFSSMKGASSEDGLFMRYRDGGSAATRNANMASYVNGTENQVRTPNDSLFRDIWYMVGYSGDGSNYSIVINGTNLPLTVVSGSNSGRWFSDISNRTDIAIGYINFQGTKIQYFSGEIAFVAVYNKILSATDQEEILSKINTLYGF
jgi:hypothetical protein